MKRMLPVVALIFSFLAFSSEMLQAQSDVLSDPREALRGMTGITVSSAQEGCSGIIDKDLVKQDVEVKLRIAGIRVTPLPIAQLNAILNCIPIEYGGKRVLTAVNLTLFVSQLVWLPPQPVRVTFATTWHQQMLFVCGAARNCEEYVRSGLRDYVDKFSNDYLAMNPKQ